MVKYIVLLPTLLLLVPFDVFCAPQSKTYPLRLQPELDNVNVESYIRNPRLFNLQMKCLLDEGPCDIVGRWIKPRMVSGILGVCLMCTPKQSVKYQEMVELVLKEYPHLYKQLFVQLIEKAGIEVDKDLKAKIFASLQEKLNVVDSDVKAEKETTELPEETETVTIQVENI